MEKDDKHAASFNAAADMEDCSTGDGVTRATETEQIKRDLKSRHINMIAIAGMIVRCNPDLRIVTMRCRRTDV